jgi:hypothetical protein
MQKVLVDMTVYWTLLTACKYLFTYTLSANAVKCLLDEQLHVCSTWLQRVF